MYGKDLIAYMSNEGPNQTVQIHSLIRAEKKTKNKNKKQSLFCRLYVRLQNVVV